ncbi:MAG TPA: hypothetical protein VK008_04650 [Sphingobacteriaceae bacterium]|nr:hypothetical protein [Sphingobacteriaceae bacterium]
MAEELTGLNQPPARHVIWVVAQGLGADSLDFYDGEGNGPKVEAPNLKAMARLGVRVGHCSGLDRRDPGHSVAYLLSSGLAGDGDPAAVRRQAGDQWLPRRASQRDKMWLSLLPHAELDWVVQANDDLPRCELAVNLPSPAAGIHWPDLIGASPRVWVDNLEDGEEMQSFVGRIIDRFPGVATQIRQGNAPEGAMEAWLEWLGDAFLRSVWYSLPRSTGMMAFLYHPGPEWYGRQAGEAGYIRGVEAVDDLVGRLLVLQDHDQVGGDMLVVVSGDYAWSQAAENRVPVLILGPGGESGLRVEQCSLADVTRLVAASL